MTRELFHWSYRHLNENANNLIKERKRAAREERETSDENKVGDRGEWMWGSETGRTTRQGGQGKWREVEERGGSNKGISG